MSKPVISVLLCDAGFSAIPILQALKGNGYSVAVCGSRPLDPGHALADQSFIVDYSDHNAVLKIFLENHFQYIIPGCTDVSYATASWIANALKLPGFDSMQTLQLFNNKGLFREHCLENDYPVPKASMHVEDCQSMQFPILMKPVISFSGRGIVKCEDMPSLKTQYQVASTENPSLEYLFEEFVSGQLYSHSAFIQDQVIVQDYFVNEYCTVNPYQVNSSHLAVDLEDHIKTQMRDWLHAFAALNHLCDGLVHTQFISNGSKVYLVESCRRCPGDLYSLLIEYATEIKYAEIFTQTFCGKKIKNSKTKINNSITHSVARHTVSVNQSCFFIKANLNLPNLLSSSYVALKTAGQKLAPAPLDRAGIYFLTFQSEKDMLLNTENLVNCIKIDSTPHPSII